MLALTPRMMVPLFTTFQCRGLAHRLGAAKFEGQV